MGKIPNRTAYCCCSECGKEGKIGLGQLKEMIGKNQLPFDILCEECKKGLVGMITRGKNGIMLTVNRRAAGPGPFSRTFLVGIE